MMLGLDQININPCKFFLDTSNIETNESWGNLLLQILIIFLLILLNAFFALAEISIITLNDNKIKRMANNGHKGAIKILNLTKNSSKFLATIQVGVTLSGFLTSASASSLFADKVVNSLSFLPIPQNIVQVISMIIVTIVLSYFSLVLGELVPKKIAMQNAEEISFKIVSILKGIETIFNPFIKLLSSSTNLVLKLLGFDPNRINNAVSEEEILMMVDVGEEKGVIEGTTKDMIKNVFEFDDKTASEIMTHRTNMFVIEDTKTIEEAVEISLSFGCSRIPVFHEDLDDIIGIVYVKDLLKYISREDPSAIKITDIMRKAIYIPETKRCSELFSEMVECKTQIAIVVDEYGGTEGLVTIEDLVESIVGDIRDEYDNDNEEIHKTGNSTFEIQGNTPLDEVSELLNIKLPDNDYETLAGFIVEHLGKIPNDNEHPSIKFEDYQFTVCGVKDRRILKVLVKKIIDDDK
ncbi:MAG: hypothetical protein RUMPE_00631 [Eubacteriales bacterium SKADARSKE-1]|nr:hypothetical protein [Eubacteriales bacterium SKADARSKE-1]